jgi:hypothetical protein
MGWRIVTRAAVALCAIALPIGLAAASVRVSGPHLPMPREILALVPSQRPPTPAAHRTPTAVATRTPEVEHEAATTSRTALAARRARAMLRPQETAAPGAEPAVRPAASPREPEAHTDMSAQTGLLPEADAVPVSRPAVTVPVPTATVPAPPVAVAAATQPAAPAGAPIALPAPAAAPAPASSPAPDPSAWSEAGDGDDPEHDD